MKTYSELYNYFRTISINDFKLFFEEKWEGNVDKLEATFKLFSYIKLFSIFNDYDVCDGNYNEMTLSKNINIKKLLDKSLGGKGDISDITFINNETKTIIVTTVKNYNYLYHINELDIRDISDLYQKNYKSNDYNLIICIVIPDKKYLYKISNCCNKTSSDLKDHILNKDTIIFDLDDIYETFNEFKYKYTNIDLSILYNLNKELLILYLHQKFSIKKTIKLLETSNEVLWGSFT